MGTGGLRGLARFGTTLVLLSGIASSHEPSGPVGADGGQLVQSGVVTVAPERSYAPFTYIDEKGVHRGISADFLSLIARKTGLTFRLLEGRPLSENLGLAREDQVDLLTSLAITPERSEYLSFSEPYVSVPAVLVLRQGWNGARDLAGLPRARVAVGKGYAVEGYLRKAYPLVVLVPVPADDVGLRMLSLGEVDGMVLDQASASFLIRRESLANLMLGSSLDFRYDLRMAWRKELTGLGRTLERGLGAISGEEREEIRSRWITVGGSEGPWWHQAHLPALTLAALLLAATWALLRHRARADARPGGWPRRFDVGEGEGRDGELIEEASRLRLGWVPWTVLAVSLGLTAGLWRAARAEEMLGLRAAFDFRVREMVESIHRRLQVNEQILLGAQGLFSGAGQVDRAGFRGYVEALRLEENAPGIQGVGFSLVVPAGERGRHEAAVRREGFPDYAIRPAGERDPFTSIVYLEPFSGRNLRAFGYDMFSEPVRRAAMERACDQNTAAVSGKVTLVQEISAKGQAGFLMYLPVYRAGASRGSEAERRTALLGWVYSPLRMDDLMAGIFGERGSEIGIEIYDGEEIAPGALMTGVEGSLVGVAPGAWFSTTRRIGFTGRTWTARLTSLSGFEARRARAQAAAPPVSGVLLSLALALAAWLLVHGRDRALRLARSMNRGLAESEERWAFAVEGAGDSAWDRDLETGRTVYSRRWKETLGYPPDEAWSDRDDWTERIHPDDVAGVMAAYESCLDGRQPVYVSEHRVRCRGGEWKWVLDRGMVVSRAEGGRALRMVGTHGDITERKRAEEELQALRTELERRVAQLEQANRELEGFSYSVSHDLRAPLRAIDGFSALLAKGHGESLDGEGQRLLGIVRSNTQKMGRLIDDLLSFSRAGRAELKRAWVPMEELAKEAFGEVVPDPEDRARIAFSVDPVQAAWGDPATLRQVWLNLLGNAVKYSAHAERPVIEVRCRNGGAETWYEVRDNGVGFDMAYAGKLFGVFERLHSVREFEGTGIGLALVKRIVERHGGRVEARGEPGRGATFSFTVGPSPGRDAAAT